MEGFIETGKALGLDGEELKTFVESKKKTDRIAREEKKDKERIVREDKKKAERLAYDEKKEVDRIAVRGSQKHSV